MLSSTVLRSHIIPFPVCVLLLACNYSHVSAAIVTEGDAFIGSDIYVATQTSDGSLTITAPTLVQTGGIFVAQQPSLTGSVTIDGGAFEGGGNVLLIGEQGTGSLDILNGGTLTTNTGADLIAGQFAGSTGNVLVSGTGSRLDMENGSANIGLGGYGTFTVENGARAYNESAFVGSDHFGFEVGGSIGIATVTGSGSRWTVGRNFRVGSDGGIGELWVLDSGRVESNLLDSSQPAIIGGVGANGLVVVEGTGSTWRQHGNSLDNEGVIVGDRGNGTVIIRDGGKVISPGLSVGGRDLQSPNSTGNVTIDGLGSLWTTTDLFVGNHGDGQILITNGGKLVSGSIQGFPIAVIGRERASFGRIVVDGLTAQWINTADDLIIGDEGSGELVIQNGATVTTTGIIEIGESSEGDGEALITGPGSRWNVTWLEVGSEGSGKITISDDAQINMVDTGDFFVDRNGIVELNEGTIRGPSTSFVLNNRGTIGGHGRLLSSSVDNTGGGKILVGSSQKLEFDQSLYNFGGRVEVLDGDLEVGSQLINNSSGILILESATLRIGQFDNNGGNVTVASGLNQLFGDIDNEGSIILSGNSQTTFYDDVQNGGAINVANGSVATFFGDVAGNGVGGGGTVFLEGDIAPGFSPGLMEYGGDVTFGDFSSLSLELTGVAPGTEYDQVQIDGEVALGGELIIDAEAALGDTTLTILEAGSILGEFDEVPELFSHVGSGMFLTDITYTDTEVTISLVENLADFNLDGFVDSQDYDLWEGGYGLPPVVSLGNGDANGDGIASGLDFLAWQRKYDPEIPELVATAQAVPEPSCFVLCVVALTAGAIRRR